jgi:hypothetical protein
MVQPTYTTRTKIKPQSKNLNSQTLLKLINFTAKIYFSCSMYSLLLFAMSFILFFNFFRKCCKLNCYIPWEDRDETEAHTENSLGLKQMLIPIIAGILSALRRVIARRVSIKVVTFM